MKAPEKIYIQSFNTREDDAKFERLLCFDDIWTEEPEPNQENIEYTRTDAFIEKALKWLEENVMKYLITTIHAGMDVPDIKNEFFDDFKNYMKGK